MCHCRRMAEASLRGGSSRTTRHRPKSVLAHTCDRSRTYLQSFSFSSSLGIVVYVADDHHTPCSSKSIEVNKVVFVILDNKRPVVEYDL